MVVKCPSCGQQVRGEPGQSGPCPKCGQRFRFPDLEEAAPGGGGLLWEKRWSTC